MNLIMVGGMEVLCSLLIRVRMLTVSKALLRSRETRMVLFSACFWLKSLVIWLLSLWSAVLVECDALKPC